ncbi:MAG: hypothetical protein QGF90_03780 [Gammaproteobacteria bacterium]|nr:hypothetical protein [Gammaproteobacteria bacterium]
MFTLLSIYGAPTAALFGQYCVDEVLEFLTGWTQQWSSNVSIIALRLGEYLRGAVRNVCNVVD